MGLQNAARLTRIKICLSCKFDVAPLSMEPDVVNVVSLILLVLGYFNHHYHCNSYNLRHDGRKSGLFSLSRNIRFFVYLVIFYFSALLNFVEKC